MNKYYYFKKRKRPKNKFVKSLGVVSIVCGILTFTYFFFPILLWEMYYKTVFAADNIESPIPSDLTIKSDLGTMMEDARNWYPDMQNNGISDKTITSYTLSIPKLRIADAVVSTVDYDLSLHLVQYFGSILPSENGTTVIFGHSTLPTFFNPKNYKTIFANLHFIRPSDEFYITIKGIRYKYTVFKVEVTSASDTSIFSQAHDTSYITLVTCTPPGTVWKRLIVRAKLSL